MQVAPHLAVLLSCLQNRVQTYRKIHCLFFLVCLTWPLLQRFRTKAMANLYVLLNQETVLSQHGLNK